MNVMASDMNYLKEKQNTTNSIADGFILSAGYFPEIMNDIGRFRVKTWRNEKGIDPIFFSKDSWIDEIDANARHWIITQNNIMVASARLSFHEFIEDVPYANFLQLEHRLLFNNSPIASINRLVVSPEFRGRGFAKLLDMERVKVAQEFGVNEIIAFPQLSRLESLEKLGFSLISQLKNIPEMPERPFFLMKLNMK
jgi:GNAT superfamily N-acetyltransferase